MPTAAQVNAPAFRLPSVTADVVALTRIDQEGLAAWAGWQDESPSNRGPSPSETGWHVLVIGRRNPPYPHEEGYVCLPGGYLDYGKEDPLGAAVRELKEETRLIRRRPSMLLVGVYGDPTRDPRRHTITIAYKTFLSAQEARLARGSDDAMWTAWVPVTAIFNGDRPTGFDHGDIIKDAMTGG